MMTTLEALSNKIAREVNYANADLARFQASFGDDPISAMKGADNIFTASAVAWVWTAFDTAMKHADNAEEEVRAYSAWLARLILEAISRTGKSSSQSHNIVDAETAAAMGRLQTLLLRTIDNMPAPGCDAMGKYKSCI
jgi:hypothetical protein